MTHRPTEWITIPLEGEGREARIEVPVNPTRAEIDGIIAALFAEAEKNALREARAAGAGPEAYVPLGWRRVEDPTASGGKHD